MYFNFVRCEKNKKQQKQKQKLFSSSELKAQVSFSDQNISLSSLIVVHLTHFHPHIAEPLDQNSTKHGTEESLLKFKAIQFS